MRNKSSQRSSSNKFLWFFTGVLLTLFACGLLFLKKRVTVVNEGQAGEVISISNVNSRQALLAASHVNHEISEPAKQKANGDQYDFYTMLPKMQVKSGSAPAPTAAATVPGPVPVLKPTKPLDVAEKSMLSPQQAAPKTTSPASTPATAPQPKPAPARKFLVSAGTFASAEDADAEKAQLLLAGIDQVRVKKTASGEYRVLVGSTYTDKTDAKKMLAQLQANQVKGSIESANP